MLYWDICLVWSTQNQKIVRERWLGWKEASCQQFVAVDGMTITDDQEGCPDIMMQRDEDEKHAGAYVGEDSRSSPI